MDKFKYGRLVPLWLVHLTGKLAAKWIESVTGEEVAIIQVTSTSFRNPQGRVEIKASREDKIRAIRTNEHWRQIKMIDACCLDLNHCQDAHPAWIRLWAWLAEGYLDAKGWPYIEALEENLHEGQLTYTVHAN